jgi:IclR family mhp operon transcriptional activator
MKKPPSHIRSVERAIDLLQALNKQAVSTLDSLHRETGLPKPTLVRLLRTLESKQLVSQSSQYGNYFLTTGVNTLSCGYHHEPLIVEAAAPIMEALTSKIKWPLSVAVFERDAMVIRFSTVHHSPWARLHSTLGMRPSLVKRAIGRAYLAFCSPEEQDVILQIVRQSDLLDNILAKDEKAVRKILNETRKRGYALSDPDASSISPTIAVPIFDEDRAIASLGLTWFSSVMTIKQTVETHLPELQEAAAGISTRLKQLRGNSETDESTSPD